MGHTPSLHFSGALNLARYGWATHRLVDLRGGSEKRMSADDEVAKHMSAAMRDERSVDTFRCGPGSW